MNLKGATTISARYRNVKAYVQTAYQLQTPMHPLRERAQRRWDTRTDPLWWSAIAHKNVGMKRTPRSWAARRVRLAFTNALRRQGYARDGSPIEESGHQSPLRGTLQLAADPGALKATTEQIETEADMVVQSIITAQSTGYGNRRPSKSTIKGQHSQPRGGFPQVTIRKIK